MKGWSKLMQVVVVKPYGDGADYVYSKEIKGELEEMQKIVGGYIEVVPATPDGEILIVCNEEGMLQNLPLNCLGIHGTIFFIGNDTPEFRGLTDKEVDFVFKVIQARSGASIHLKEK